MEQYVEHIVPFTVFVLLGIIVNFVRKKAKRQSLTAWRVAEEMFGTIWVSLVVAGGLDTLTDWTHFFIFGIASVAGFFHSFIIDKIGRGLLEYVSDKIKEKIDKTID